MSRVISFGLGARIITVIWIGSLWTVGYLVAPTLFQLLDDRVLAGLLAGRLFTIESYLGLLCGGLLLLLELIQAVGRRLNWRVGLLALMLVIIVVGQFVIQPEMAELKSQGETQGAMFARMHALASGLYLVNSLLGLVWVIFWDRR